MPIVQDALKFTQTLFERFLQKKLFLNNQIHILELKPGQNISMHTHDNIYLQGVLHFQSLSDGDGGELEFYSADKQLITSLSPIEDSAILFPGTTIHTVNTNTSTVARHSMSFGYKIATNPNVFMSPTLTIPN
jgi:predicted 2-oxoglutarate/Fe(II)-dependent dioxygenase YbiX